jgi:heme-degrading monooxygenase HmoA
MIVEYIRYTVPAERQEAFIRDYAAAKQPLMRSPYARGFDMCQCVEDPSKFFVRIEWTSADDHMKGFRGSDEFKAFFAHIRAYVGMIEEMRHYAPV